MKYKRIVKIFIYRKCFVILIRIKKGISIKRMFNMREMV